MKWEQNPYNRQIVSRLKQLKRKHGLRYWNEVARLAKMEPASLYAKVRGDTAFSLQDVFQLERAFCENILMIVGPVVDRDE